MRRSARSLGMNYWQDMRYIVWPIGLRAVLPSWVGVALGVMKDSALVSALKYFGALHVLKGIDLTVSKGEVLSIIGASGSGKSVISANASMTAAAISFEGISKCSPISTSS